jgi:branched-chain amino acid transport system permease protein
MNSDRLTILAHRYSTLVVLLVPLLVLTLVVSLFGQVVLQRIVIVLFINMMMVLALQMFMGNSGVVSFGHIAFMGIGAYASALFSMSPSAKGAALRTLYPILQNVHVPFVPALLIGGLIAAVIAALIGFPMARLSGAAAVIATLALLVITHTVLLNWSQVTNGPRVLFGVDGYTTLWNTAIAGLLTGILAFWFKETPLGLMLRATREDEYAAASIGVNIITGRWVAFILSAFVTAVAGGLWAHFITIFSPISFYLTQTFLIVMMLIVGGMESVSGAVVGAVLITAVYEGLRAVENGVNMSNLLPGTLAGFTEVMLAITMILLLIRRPAGVMGGREFKLPLGWLSKTDPTTDLAEQEA